MNRRAFLKSIGVTIACAPLARTRLFADSAAVVPSKSGSLAPAFAKDWLGRWERHILGEARQRYCDHETGEELGWLVSPSLNGFYYGYRATHDTRWVEFLLDWADSWLKRGVTEPDGYLGWPKSGTGGMVAKGLYGDSLLGEAMALRPIVLMADEILKTRALKEKFGMKAESFFDIAGKVFQKWDARGCWREVKEGGVWVVPEFGIDQQTGKWTQGYEQRHTEGFTNPDNKQNHIARWLIAMHDATKKPLYRERAQKWWHVMKSRMKTRENGKYFVWNYREPAGPWDYKPDGSPRHWIGVHPNGGYYEIDVKDITDAFEHELVFSQQDIQRLIATNRDFMWDQQLAGAKFQRIDGGQPDPRWKDSPGTLWKALVPRDETLRKIFLANHNPESWGGLAITPWFLSLT
jgi:hypothetical protein